jgi:hypothetical protein
VYHIPQDLTVGDLLHGAVLASVDVEPVHTTSVYKALVRFHKSDNVVPVRLVVHGRHIAFLDHTVLLGEIGFRERLSLSAMFISGQ